MISFEPRRPFVEVELLGISNETGRPYYVVNMAMPEEDGGGYCGMWDGDNLPDAMAAAYESDGLPVIVRPSART